MHPCLSVYFLFCVIYPKYWILLTSSAVSFLLFQLRTFQECLKISFPSCLSLSLFLISQRHYLQRVLASSVLTSRSSCVRLLSLSSVLFACRSITCRQALLFGMIFTETLSQKSVQRETSFFSVQASKKNDAAVRGKHLSPVFRPKILVLYVL